MKRCTSRVLTLAALAIGMMFQVACSNSSQLPEVFGSAPLAMNKAGASANVDFIVTQANIDKYRRLMVSLNFPRTKDLALEHAFRQKDMPVEVEVVQLDDRQSTPVATQDYNANRNGTRQTGMARANMNLYGWDSDTSFVLIAGFYPPKPGKYRATVRVVEDQPLFSGVDSVIKVEQYYNTGE